MRDNYYNCARISALPDGTLCIISDNPDLGYTGRTQFDDGEIIVVNYIKDDAPKAHIRAYAFRPDDVALPPHEGDTKRVFG